MLFMLRLSTTEYFLWTPGIVIRTSQPVVHLISHLLTHVQSSSRKILSEDNISKHVSLSLTLHCVLEANQNTQGTQKQLSYQSNNFLLQQPASRLWSGPLNEEQTYTFRIYGIIESLRLEKTSKIIESNHNLTILP